MTNGTTGTGEVELKLAVRQRDMPGLARALAAMARPGQAGPAVDGRLRSVYFDTADFRLARAGLALRLRHSGEGRLLSVKADAASEGGLQRALEWEGPLIGAALDIAQVGDAALRRRIETALGGAVPEPRFETDVRRLRFLVEVPGGLVEVALDRGRIRAGAASEPVSEVELELLEGDPAGLYALAETLVGRLPACPQTESKADRGRRLAGGGERVPRGAATSGASLPFPSAGAAALHWLGLHAAAAGRALALVLTDPDPEGPHALRVSLRRLRAALWLFAPVLRQSFRRETAAWARNLGRVVAPLRDADVLAGSLLIPRARAEDPGLAEALDRWRARLRARTRRQLRAAGATAAILRLHGQLVLGAHEGQRRRAREARARPLLDVAAPRLARHWARIRAAGDRLAALDAEARHQLRKDVKKLRYALEMAAPVEGMAFVAALRRLQDSLGRLNDLAVLGDFRPALGDPGLVARFEALVASTPAGGRESRDLAMGRACRHWRALARLNPPWAAEGAEPQRPRAAPNP